jgi:hypothetical protein
MRVLRADERREKRKKERARAHQVRAGTERDDGSERESKKMRMEKKLASILFQNQRARNSQAPLYRFAPSLSTQTVLRLARLSEARGGRSLGPRRLKLPS